MWLRRGKGERGGRGAVTVPTCVTSTSLGSLEMSGRAFCLPQLVRIWLFYLRAAGRAAPRGWGPWAALFPFLFQVRGRSSGHCSPFHLSSEPVACTLPGGQLVTQKDFCLKGRTRKAWSAQVVTWRTQRMTSLPEDPLESGRSCLGTALCLPWSPAAFITLRYCSVWPLLGKCLHTPPWNLFLTFLF